MCTGHLHICTEEGVHLHMLTIVKMDICTYGQLWTIVDKCGHGHGHEYCVMQLISPYTERRSSETWKRLKKKYLVHHCYCYPHSTQVLCNMEAVLKGICAISAILVTRVHGVIREVNAAAIHRFEQDSRCADLV